MSIYFMQFYDIRTLETDISVRVSFLLPVHLTITETLILLILLTLTQTR